MRKISLLTTFVVIPILALAACSPSTSAIVQSAQSQASTQTTSQATSVSQTSSSTSGDLETLQSELESVYNAVSPSVVSIEVQDTSTTSSNSGFGNGSTNPYGNSPFGNNSNGNNSGSTTSSALASGFVWDKQGDIVTNNHVVSGASSITVTFIDGTTATAKVVGTDPNSDLAVIKVSVDSSLLVPVTMGDSTQVKVGDVAIAIGNPYGLSWTMTQGIISALSRSIPADSSNSSSATSNSSSTATYDIPDIIQTDAAINPGNSGGVLLNLEGQVIGVTSAIESSTDSNTGVGYVIPSLIVSKVVPTLISTGSYSHAYLGITGMDLNSNLASQMGLSTNQKGALVVSVTSGGPADKAGLQGSTKTVTIDGQEYQIGGDVIIAIDGQKVQNMEDLSTYLFLDATAGQQATLTVIRNGTQTTVTVTTGTLPTN